MVSEIAQFWLDQRAGDGETGVIVALPLKCVCTWDEYGTPAGSWVLRADVRQWVKEHGARIHKGFDHAEMNIAVRFPPDQSSLATLFKLTFHV